MNTSKLKSKKLNFWYLTVIFPVTAIVLFVLNIYLGSIDIPFMQIIEMLSGGTPTHESWANILFDFRLPKATAAVLVGAGLAIGGLLMQTLFNNPLAGPFVLGITSGASLGVALLVMASQFLISIFPGFVQVGNWTLILSGCLGAGLVLLVVLLVSASVKSSMTLLIVGLLFGSTAGALVSILQFFSDKEQIQTYVIWTFGSLGGLTWEELALFVPVVVIGLVMAFLLKKPLNALLIGEEYAQSMGVKVKRVRVMIIIITSLLAGSITAFCGPIAFIGIAVPHMARIMLNSGNHHYLIPATIMLGIIVMLICDTIAQIPGSQYILPINAITSLFGAPMVLWIVLGKKDFRASFA
ncbi:iron ABC transporter permease [Fulvivirgaceae bacterium BMA12]|uniref:Iron ABC transporter permease n=1 Tax=Agaribacillus aureus TaxID=3051825 RepID=A0ABT8LD51_9BACT|nr:iron ABC transporter permease [Fulvivirgaceae bacterium BMA12]